MARVIYTFDSQQFDFPVVMADNLAYPHETIPALDGTSEHHFVAPWPEADSFILSGSGLMKVGTYDTLRGKITTSASLVTSYGTCTATMLECSRLERPGYTADSKEIYQVQLVFKRTSAWS